MPFSAAAAAQWQKRMEDGLHSTLAFWMAHSIDSECGGYFNNIDR